MDPEKTKSFLEQGECCNGLERGEQSAERTELMEPELVSHPPELCQLVSPSQEELTRGNSHRASREINVPSDQKRVSWGGTNIIISEQLTGVENGQGDSTDLNNSDSRKIKTILHSILSSCVYRTFGVLLIILDIILVFKELIFTRAIYIPFGYLLVLLAIALFFFLDLLVRVYLEQFYFSDAFHILDAIVTIVILLLNVVCIFYNIKFVSDIPRSQETLHDTQKEDLIWISLVLLEVMWFLNSKHLNNY
nr:phosphatidylinositol 3,4,5-trisphosphate 3-phosphatase TPTE2-like isoform X2 [Microcebus murinus]